MKNSKLPKLIGFGLVFLASVGGLTFVYNRVKDFDDEYQRIRHADEKVIESLVKIRLAEKAYFGVNNRYTNSFDTLADFLATGNFAITTRQEIIHTLRPGVDSIELVIDTLDLIPVYDSLQGKLELRRSELYTIGDLPDEEGQFELWINERSGQHFIEVMDPKPINPRRKPDTEDENPLSPLKFGSKASPTTKGNWE